MTAEYGRPPEPVERDPLAGTDGTQEPPPPPLFPDPCAGLVTGVLLFDQAPAPLRPVRAPELPRPDAPAVREAASALASVPRRPARKAPAAPPRQPAVQRPAAALGRGLPAGGGRSGASRAIGCLIALIVFGLIAFSLIRGLLESLIGGFH